MSEPDAGREWREWIGFALAMGLTAFELYLLVPAFRSWCQDAARQVTGPIREHRRRQADARAMMRDVIEVSVRGVPDQWTREAA